jgi:hypothetical protein
MKALLLFAVLSSPQQEPAAREDAGGLVFARPKGWTSTVDPNTKITMLRPPGLRPGEECVVTLYPTSAGFSGTDQELHDAIFKDVTRAGTVDGAPRTGKTGIFQSSRAKLTTPMGEAWLIVYSAKSGDRIGGGVLVAGSEALLDAHRPAVEEMLKGMRFAGDEAPAAPPQPAVPAAGQTFNGLVIPLPAGWTRKDEPGGLISLSPPPPRSALEPAWDYVMYVLPSQPLLGTFWQTHKAIFQEALKSSGLKDPVPATHNADEPGPFIRSASAGRDAAGAVRSISMYSALSDGKIECILIHHQEDRDGLRPILARTAVKTPPRRSERPKIVEAYRRMDQKLYINAAGGAPIAGSLKYERIWLRSDGVADFSTYYPEGYATAGVVFKQDPGLNDGTVGSWKRRGDTQVEITRTEGGKAEVYQRENGRLRFGDQLWQPMPPVDGMQLEGRWSLAAPPGFDVPASRIQLTKDGRFQDEGILDHVSLPDLKRGKPPKKGSGTYELRDWTIFLRYDDGTTWSTDFSTIGSDPKDHSSILFGVFAIPRE